MNRSCTDCRTRLDDFLDELLPAGQAADVERHLSDCAACGQARAALARTRARLYHPYDVPPPATDLLARIRLGVETYRPRRANTLLRYAASFAAGVVVTLAVTSLRATDAVPASGVTALPPPTPASAPPAAPAPLRRIR